MKARTKSRSVQLPITDKLAQALREIMPVGDDEPPTAIVGWPAPGRLWKRIDAHYRNGWTVRVNFGRAGAITSSSARFRMITGKRGSVVLDEAA